jgi:hypothetical protein
MTGDRTSETAKVRGGRRRTLGAATDGSFYITRKTVLVYIQNCQLLQRADGWLYEQKRISEASSQLRHSSCMKSFADLRQVEHTQTAQPSSSLLLIAWVDSAR